MFIISKVISFFFSPILWLVILLLFAVGTKIEKKRKKFLKASLIIAIVFSNPWFLNLVEYPFHTSPMPMKQNEHYDLGIVLGGMTRYDPVNKKGYFNISSDRFIQTALLYKMGHIKKIMVCGGQNGLIKYKDFTEAGFVAQNLRDLGIPASDIILEDRSKTTAENAFFAKKILDTARVLKGRAVLITSAFHMPRAVKTFEAEGISVRPYPCVFSVLPSSLRPGLQDLIPNANVMGNWSGFIKEIIGRAYLSITAYF